MSGVWYIGMEKSRQMEEKRYGREDMKVPILSTIPDAQSLQFDGFSVYKRVTYT